MLRALPGSCMLSRASRMMGPMLLQGQVRHSVLTRLIANISDCGVGSTKEAEPPRIYRGESKPVSFSGEVFQ